MTAAATSRRPVVALVQARMGSQRFPGKMMAAFAGRPILEWVLRRAGRAQSLDAVVLATSDRDADTPLAELAERLSVAVFRGSENDVLGRFCGAARAAGAGTVVRICADNPLVAPEAIDVVVSAFLESAADYAFNHVPRLRNGYPDGIGAEVLTSEMLYRLDAVTHDPAHREHVTSYLWNHADRFDILAAPCPDAWRDDAAHIRLDVDREDDLKALNAIYRGDNPDMSVLDVLAPWRDTAISRQAHSAGSGA